MNSWTLTITPLLVAIIVIILQYSIVNRHNRHHENISACLNEEKNENILTYHTKERARELVESILEELPFHPPFPRYMNAPDDNKDIGAINGCFSPLNSLIPTWVVTLNSSSTSIHRFFDSSPFSPSGRYLGLTRMHNEGHRVKEGDSCEIVVIDLMTGVERVVATSLGWDTQTGAHVQWGASDQYIIFNDVVDGVSRGRIMNPLSQADANGSPENKNKILQCPIYHVSYDGRYAASPSLEKIRFTQLGYGTHTHLATKNYLPEDLHRDGIFVTDLESGQCRKIISLGDLMKLLPASSLRDNITHRAFSWLLKRLHRDIQAYGFHTKWSNDNQQLLVVMRTLHAHENIFKAMLGHVTRRQHLFAMSSNGSNARHIITWGSESKPPTSSLSSQILDGNHPNWIPHNDSLGYLISMNLEHDSLGEREEGGGKEEKQDKVCLSTLNDKRGKRGKRGKSWRVVSFDADNPPLPPQNMFPVGSGHPVFLPGGRLLLMDAYPKERSNLPQSDSISPKCVPLRLVDIHQQKEVWLLQIQTERDNEQEALALALASGVTKQPSQSRAWRCDPHPAIDSKTHSWIAFNGRPTGGNRQVLIAYLGKDPYRLFKSQDYL